MQFCSGLSKTALRQSQLYKRVLDAPGVWVCVRACECVCARTPHTHTRFFFSCLPLRGCCRRRRTPLHILHHFRPSTGQNTERARSEFLIPLLLSGRNWKAAYNLNPRMPGMSKISYCAGRANTLCFLTCRSPIPHHERIHLPPNPNDLP